MPATWDIFLSARLEVRRGLTTDAVHQALSAGEILDDDLARPAGTAVPWTRLADLPELAVPQEPAPAPEPPAPDPDPEPDPPAASTWSMHLEPVPEPEAAAFDPIRTAGDQPAMPPFDRQTADAPAFEPDPPSPASTAAHLPATPTTASAEWHRTRDFADAVWADADSLDTPPRRDDDGTPLPSADFEAFATDDDFSPPPDDALVAEVDVDEDSRDISTPSGIAPVHAERPLESADDEDDEPALLAAGPTGGVEDLDLTAMADIAMQMIMFLLVAATVVYFKTLEIPAPNPDEGQAVAQEMKTLEDLMDDFILVEIAADGSVQVDREPVPTDQLIGRLRKARTDTLRTSMLLSAEFATPHANAVAALDAANEIGLAIALAKPSAAAPP